MRRVDDFRLRFGKRELVALVPPEQAEVFGQRDEARAFPRGLRDEAPRRIEIAPEVGCRDHLYRGNPHRRTPSGDAVSALRRR